MGTTSPGDSAPRRPRRRQQADPPDSIRSPATITTMAGRHLVKVSGPQLAGLAAVLMLATALVAWDTLTLHQAGGLAATLVIAFYVIICAWAPVLALFARHPRLALICWLSAAGMLGVLPCTVAAWWLVASRKYRSAPPPQLPARPDAGRACTLHMVIGCEDCGPGSAGLLDDLAVAVALVTLAVGQLDYIAEIQREAAPVWAWTMRDDLHKAADALARVAAGNPG